MMKLLDLVKDPYERKARATPGFLVILPLLVAMVGIYGPKNPILTAVFSLVGACGGVFALANVVRGKGKQLEEKLIIQWGGMPTTIVLRHRDGFFDSLSKQRYHDAIEKKLNIKMPSADDEVANPEAADDIYSGATRRLRELTRTNKGLLLKENIAYGFHRNMMAIRVLGTLTSLIGIAIVLIGSGLVSIHPFEFNSLTVPVNPAIAMTALISIALLLGWIFYFNADSTRRVGFVYAERLFECLNSIKQPPKRTLKKTATDEGNEST
jgi:hypothetical protein